jgi:hypothetical protein
VVFVDRLPALQARSALKPRQCRQTDHSKVETR